VRAHLARHGWDVVALSRGQREVPDELNAHGIEHRTIDREDAGALRGALGGDVDVLIDVVAFTADHAAEPLELDGQVGSVVAISSASVHADALGRTLDESADEPSFPELPVPIAETQTTVRPGPETYSTLKVALKQTLLEQDVVPATGAATVRDPWTRGASRVRVVGHRAGP